MHSAGSVEGMGTEWQSVERRWSGTIVGQVVVGWMPGGLDLAKKGVGRHAPLPVPPLSNQRH